MSQLRLHSFLIWKEKKIFQENSEYVPLPLGALWRSRIMILHLGTTGVRRSPQERIFPTLNRTWTICWYCKLEWKLSQSQGRMRLSRSVRMLFSMQKLKVLFWNIPPAMSCLENVFAFGLNCIINKMEIILVFNFLVSAQYMVSLLFSYYK